MGRSNSPRSNSPSKFIQPGEAFEGLFCLLPQWKNIPKHSIVQQQKNLNPGFAGHHIVITDVFNSGRIAKCPQSTSLNQIATLPDGTTKKHHQRAMEKFSPSLTDDILRFQHSPVLSNHKSTTHNNLLLLELQDGIYMTAQFFIKLDHYLDIETELLLHWGGNRYALTKDSLCRLILHFKDFVSGNMQRVQWIPGRPMSPPRHLWAADAFCHLAC